MAWNSMFKKLALIFFVLVVAGCSTKQTLKTPVAPETTSRFPATADEVSISAMSLIGTPYLWGGNTPDSGFDCSGLIVYVYKGTGIQLPRTTSAMSSMKKPNVSQNALKTGDLVFFATGGGRKVSHAGIYVGNGRFVHAPSSGGVVKLSNLRENYWRKHFVSAKRVIH